MRYDSVRKQYKRVKTPAKLTSVISYGFASAIASVDEYHDETVRAAIKALGQDPDELRCVYCGRAATGWDHLHALVEHGEYSGWGHVLANLVPSCAECNASKGNSDWCEWMRKKGFDGNVERVAQHQARLEPDRFEGAEIAPLLAQYHHLKEEIIERMHKAEALSREIRATSERTARRAQDTAA